MLDAFQKTAQNAALPDIQDVAAIAREAGRALVAMRPFVLGTVQYKADASPVTDADKKSSEIVINGLSKLTPAIPVISEENPQAQNEAIQAAHSTYWIVDPLDGTRSYISGHPGFGVHIGLIVNEQPVMAAIYFPADGVLYFTDGVNGAFREEDGKPAERISVPGKIADGDIPRAAVSWFTDRHPDPAVLPYHPVTAVGGGRLCMVAKQGADLSITEGPFAYWDLAASHALLKAAGGELYGLHDGAPVAYPPGSLQIRPTIGGHKDIVEKYREAFKAAVGQLKPKLPAPPAP